MRFLSIDSFLYFVNFLKTLGYKEFNFDMNNIRGDLKKSRCYISTYSCFIEYIGNTIQITFYDAYGVVILQYVLEKRGNNNEN